MLRLLVMSLLMLGYSYGQTLIDSSQALAEALKAGGDYLLAEGEYILEETVTVTTDLSLVGAGMNATVIASSAELNLLPIRGKVNIYLEGINFEHRGDLRGGVVDIEDATFEIVACRFAGGVFLEPTEEDPLYYGSGLAVNGQGRGTVRDSVFIQNQQDGVHLEEEAEVVIYDSVFTKNGGGVVIFDDTKAEVYDSEFSAIDLDGENSIATYIDGNAELTLEGNSFSKNIGGSIYVLGSGTVVAKGNAFDEGEFSYSAVTAGEAATLEFENNVITNHPAGALYAYGEANVTLTANRIQGGGSEADMIYLGDTVRGSLRDNQVTETVGLAFTALDEAVAELKGNRFENNGGWTAVYIGGATQIDFSHNRVRSNAQLGVYVTADASAAIISNFITENGEDGIQARESAQMTITLNRIVANGWDGIYMEGEARAYIAANTIRKNEDNAIRLSGLSFASVVANDLNSNGQSGLVLHQESRALVNQNKALSNTWNGVATTETSFATVRQNTLSNNGLRGVLFMDSSSGVAAENTLAGNEHGIFIEGEATPLILENTFRNNETDIDSGTFSSE